VQDLVAFVLIPLDLDGEVIPFRMLEEFDEQLRGIRGHLGMSGECCEEILIGRLWAPHSSVLAIGVSPTPAARFLTVRVSEDSVRGERCIVVGFSREGGVTVSQFLARGN
jgi:hypothetical protein